MFALLQVMPFDGARSIDGDESTWVVRDGDDGIEVVKIDSSEKRLREYAANYQRRYRAATKAFNALDPGGKWPEQTTVFFEVCAKYKVIGHLTKETTFHVVKVFDSA